MELLHTLLELGHTTSSSLGFAYDLSPKISYGEETITESNLLEIQRRHPRLSRIETFSKQVESSQTGADWEWHLIGRSWTLKLRVQAKRVTKSGGIKGIFQKAQTASDTQVDCLIKSARKDGLCPVYCFYCAERHRDIWSLRSVGRVEGALETGCLLAPAEVVKSLAPTKLEQIEPQTKPWHFLWARKCYSIRKESYSLRYKEYVPTDRYLEEIEVRDYLPREGAIAEWELPTVPDLNRDDRELLSEPGIFKSEPDQLYRQLSPSYFEERGISLIMLLDVSQPDMLLGMSRSRS